VKYQQYGGLSMKKTKTKMVLRACMVFIVILATCSMSARAMTWEEYQQKIRELKIEEASHPDFSDARKRVTYQLQQLQREYLRDLGVVDTNGDGTFDLNELNAQTYRDSSGRYWLNGTSAPKQTHTHEYGEGVVTREPTCAEEGAITYTCTTCGATKTEAIAALPHTYKTEITIEPTCTETGEITFTCTVCGYSYADALPSGNHEYVSEVVLAPTCTERGEELHTCALCGATYTTEPGMLGHRNREWVLYSLPTCTEYGVDELVCADCGYFFEIRQVEPLGHTEGDWVLVTPRTFTKPAYYERYCTVCDALLATGTAPPDTEGLKRAVLITAGAGVAAFGAGCAVIVIKRKKKEKSGQKEK
jgi:hypothetical protein